MPIEISTLSRISVAGFAKKTEESAGGKDNKTPRLLKVGEPGRTVMRVDVSVVNFH